MAVHGWAPAGCVAAKAAKLAIRGCRVAVVAVRSKDVSLRTGTALSSLSFIGYWWL